MAIRLLKTLIQSREGAEDKWGENGETRDVISFLDSRDHPTLQLSNVQLVDVRFQWEMALTAHSTRLLVVLEIYLISSQKIR